MTRICPYMLLLFFTCLAIILQAQYRFDNYTHLTTADGLSSNNVYDFAEDKYGFIWMATSRGLVRYDGSKAILLKPNEQDSVFLASEYITALLVSGDSLWIGTRKGLSILDLENGKMSNHVFPSEIEIEESAAHKGREFLIRDLYEDRQGNIWIAQQFSGFVQWERATQSFHDFPLFPDDNLPSVYSQRDQTTLIAIIQDNQQDSIMWAASMAGMIRLNRVTGEIKRILFEEEERYQFNRKICIYQDENRTIYTGSWHSGLSIYHPDKEVYVAPAVHQTTQLPPELKKNHLFAITKGKDEQLYLTFWYGLYTYDQQNGQFQLIKQSDYKGNANVGFGIDFIDSEGRIWYGSGGGVVIADPMVHQFQWYDLSELNPTNLRSNQRALVEDFYEGYISVSGQYMNGIYHVSPKTGHAFKDAFTSDMMTNDVLSAWGISLLNPNTLLISTETQLYTLEKNNRQFTPYLLDLPLEYGALKENSIDRQGTAWLGTARDGVFAVNTKRKELVNYQDSLPYTHIYRPFEDSAGNVWMLNNSGHLVYDLRLDRIHVFDSNADTTKTFLLGRNFCECPNGEVWLAGSDGGLGLLSQTTPEKGIIQKIIPTHPARAKISIQGIACNSKNELWAIDNDVIIKINRADWSYDFFQLDYGVKSWFGLFRLLKNDQLFIGAQDGFYLLDTKQLLVNERVPKPYVSKIITTESEQNQIEAYLKSKPISLSPSENVVTIEFSAINHTLPEKTKYLYQLEGIDKDWIDPKENRAFTYSYLPGGDYTFKIKAANNEGIWSEAYELPIHVGTPWYKTTLFWMALISLILTLAYLYYRNRIRRIQRDNQLKSDFERKVADLEMGALRAQMNPHFIFNCLNSIEAFVIRNDTRKASKYLNAFGKLVRLILQNSRQAYVNLQDELDSLKLYIELEQMRFQNRFQYELILKDGLVAENYKVPPMLLQPFVENSILHGLHPKRENGKIIITISEQNDALECVIEDNGIGRVAAAKIKASRKVKRKSMGMDITIERIETLNKIHNTSNQVFIKDLYDEERNALGTEVRVVIPF